MSPSLPSRHSNDNDARTARSMSRRAFRSPLPAYIVAGLICVWTAYGADWPHYRGPDYNGISTEKNLNFGNMSELWKANVDTGFSSLAVVRGLLYTMGNRDGTDVVHCRNAENGDAVWSYSYPCKLDPNMYEGGPNATPTVSGGKVYTVSKEGHLLCFDAKTGKKHWERNAVRDFGASRPAWGFSGSATVIGDAVIFNVGPAGLALHKDTGETLWSSGSGISGYATPVPYSFRDEVAVVIFGAERLNGARVVDGKSLWSHKWKTDYEVNAADPVVFGNYVFLSSGYGKGCAVVDVGGAEPVALWTNKEIRNHFSSSVLWRGHVYGFDGNANRRSRLVCATSAAGAVKWQTEDVGFGSVILADGRLIMLNEGGELVVATATQDGYREVARKHILKGKCWTAPALSNGRIYARAAGGDLVCIDVRMPENEGAK